MSSKYRISDHQDLHFISFAVVQWVDALSRPIYKDAIIKSLHYCQKEKGLLLYAYVIMINHVHLIIAAKDGYNLSSILRDFKRHTSKELLQLINGNLKESRRNWMMCVLAAKPTGDILLNRSYCHGCLPDDFYMAKLS